MSELVFEIGVEEIPAGFLQRVIPHLRDAAPRALAEARLEVPPQAVRVLAAPRRLALLVDGIPARQPDLAERVVGPPASAAFKDGKPTKAAEGFAKKNGVSVDDLEQIEVEGQNNKKSGLYVACTRREQGKPAAEVLPGVLEALVAGLPWPKSMRWNWLDETFARPVHWIVALYGGKLLSVGFGGVMSGKKTRGHRFLAPKPFALEGTADDYVHKLREAFVIVDHEARRQTIAAELARVESEAGARVRPDDALLDEVAFLVEYPVAVWGAFDPAYLQVPEEVIVSAMRSHQRYFAMADEHGALANKFVTIAGTITKDPQVVRHGNERVLAARLADARFFFDEDRKNSLDEHAARLDAVVFQSKLGSIGAKVQRVGAIGGWLARELDDVDAGTVERAAALCKADLVTRMVGEFPDLQGVMGGHYARHGGEPAAVGAAIVEHYQPRGAGAALPASPAGAALAIADRIDTIVGCFAVGLAPTGSADPYALRRAALGVIAVLLDRRWRVSLAALIDRATAALSGTVEVGADTRAQLLEFFRVRLRGVLADGELPADCVDAALAAGFHDLPDAAARARAVARLRSRADFEPLATAFKRVANILKGESAATEPDPERFAEEAERGLWDAFGKVRSRVQDHLGGGDYNSALSVLTELKEPVDVFFDKVLVMDEDEAVRDNRLALLSTINAAFSRIADFRQLAV